MSRVLTATDIAERALGTIGSFPVTESAPDPAHLRRALEWLDMNLSELVGTERMFSRVESGTLSVTITNGTQSYNLYSALGSNAPDEGIEYVVDAFVEDANGNRSLVTVVGEQTFENVSLPAETGPIQWVTIEREENDPDAAPTLRIYPTPATTDSNTYTLKLMVQKFAPNVAPEGVTGEQPQNVAHRMGQAWQRYLVCQLAHDLGAGPLLKLSEQRLTRLAAMAVTAKGRLLAFENRPHDTEPPISEPWGLS